MLILFLAAVSTSGAKKPNVVGWYDPRTAYVDAMPPEKLDFESLTHLVFGSPSVDAHGNVDCSPPNASAVGGTLRRLATKHGVKMQWSMIPLSQLMLHVYYPIPID